MKRELSGNTVGAYPAHTPECTEQPGAYWLVCLSGTELLLLYDHTSLCEKVTAGWVQTPSSETERESEARAETATGRATETSQRGAPW